MSTTKMKPEDLTRDDMLEMFVRAVNICEPDHPYRDPYPITPKHVDYSYCQSTGRYYAKCGPRSGIGIHVVGYSVDKTYMQNCSRERHLSIICHELTHITEGSHTDGSTHNPAFWREMAFNALQLRDHLEEMESVMGPLDEEQFVIEVVNDPNSTLVDNRIETAQERKEKLADLLGFDTDIIR